MAGCGCKNKPQGQPAPSTPPPASSQTSQRQVTNNNIQESIKKVVEKYYNKR
jgi:hypothetical protein